LGLVQGLRITLNFPEKLQGFQEIYPILGYFNYGSTFTAVFSPSGRASLKRSLQWGNLKVATALCAKGQGLRASSQRVSSTKKFPEKLKFFQGNFALVTDKPLTG
jgi:hypothetical protein